MSVPGASKPRTCSSREGFEVDDKWLTSKEATEAFKAQHGVKTTPQVFIGETRVGGYDDLRRYFGKPVADPKATSYRPVIALFSHDGADGARRELCRLRHSVHRTARWSGSSPSAWRCWRC